MELFPREQWPVTWRNYSERHTLNLVQSALPAFTASCIEKRCRKRHQVSDKDHSRIWVEDPYIGGCRCIPGEMDLQLPASNLQCFIMAQHNIRLQFFAGLRGG